MVVPDDNLPPSLNVAVSRSSVQSDRLRPTWPHKFRVQFPYLCRTPRDPQCSKSQDLRVGPLIPEQRHVQPLSFHVGNQRIARLKVSFCAPEAPRILVCRKSMLHHCVLCSMAPRVYLDISQQRNGVAELILHHTRWEQLGLLQHTDEIKASCYVEVNVELSVNTDLAEDSASSSMAITI